MGDTLLMQVLYAFENLENYLPCLIFTKSAAILFDSILECTSKHKLLNHENVVAIFQHFMQFNNVRMTCSAHDFHLRTEKLQMFVRCGIFLSELLFI